MSQKKYTRESPIVMVLHNVIQGTNGYYGQAKEKLSSHIRGLLALMEEKRNEKIQIESPDDEKQNRIQIPQPFEKEVVLR